VLKAGNECLRSTRSARADWRNGNERLVALHKASKGLITERQAAAELGQSERHIRRLLKRLKGKGDRSD
jgi:hypothetical protein